MTFFLSAVPCCCCSSGDASSVHVGLAEGLGCSVMLVVALDRLGVAASGVLDGASVDGASSALTEASAEEADVRTASC